MNAESLLVKIASAINKSRLEAVMIGNAGAALHGAPVTTLDIDFMFRHTSANLKKLKVIADTLNAYILKPYYPMSGLYRIINEDIGLQLDFMSAVHGINSFESLRSRAINIDFNGNNILVADLEDIIISKRSAARPRDIAVIEILEAALYEKRTKR
jgi:predicted nucleotidyltransferase